jgi:hypothetical protein
MLIGPMTSGDNPSKVLVEPPGIAPGSSPLIARAFMSIVGASPDRINIGSKGYRFHPSSIFVIPRLVLGIQQLIA